MAKLVSFLFKAAHILTAIFFLAGLLIPFLPSEKYWLISVIGLILPILAILLLIFLIVWAIARSKWAFLSLIVLAIGWKQLSVMFGTHFFSSFEATKKPSSLRILTWNTSSWSETNKSDKYRNFDTKPMVEYAISQQADIMCFQEFFDLIREKSDYSILKTFKEAGFKYNYFVKTYYGTRKYKTGVAIVSKYPIVDTASFFYGLGDFAEHLLYADIQYNDKKIRVFTTHLQSVRFDGQQYDALRNIKNPEHASYSGSKMVASKLKIGYMYRAKEADLIHEKVTESPYPVVLCGDFNDVPNSYTYFTAKGDLQDAFLRKGKGFGATFQYISPTLRIDYILVDKTWQVGQFKRIVSNYSDHYPIITDLEMKK